MAESLGLKAERALILAMFGFAPLKAVERGLRKFGDRFEFSAGGRRTILFSDPRDIASILEDHPDSFQKDLFTHYMKDLWGRGIILAEGEVWRQARRRFQPYFGSQFLKSYSLAFRRLSSEAIKMWPEGEIDISRHALDYSLYAVIDTLFGVDPKPHIEQVVRDLDVILKYFLWLQALAGFTDTPEKIKFGPRRAYEKAIQNMRMFADHVIEIALKRDQPEKFMVDKLVRDWMSGNDPLDRELIKDEIVTFLSAGHESTALATAFATNFIGQNKAVARRIFEELEKNGFKTGEGPVLQKESPYLEAVVREGLRILPPVWISGREATRTVTVNGLTLEKGDQAHLCFWNAQRDSRWHENAHEFRPERWLANERAESMKAFFPFGAGPRACVGMQFAINEIGILLAEAVHRFEFESMVEGTPSLKATITIRPSKPMKIRTRLRLNQGIPSGG